ncbi:MULTISPECIES: glutamate 5-kinase [Enterococcus]|uniref:glutamate 5-kinase n=1 Tax=Enterococcus TaxID=1350 RepID=UPI0008D8995F|nr:MULTISPECIES: glutamate 5-kinase [Enterococcus]SET53898.1 glutamate 5-kinase [Enterococcus malodoratus]HCM87788.1 glutamate 5-kinase [Enterococcus sp.]
MREEIKKATVIVIKVGTSLLVSPETGIIETAIPQLASVLSELIAMGKKPILVSSGAVGAGVTELGEVSKQTAAAVGQGLLTSLYEEAFNQQNQKIGQLLLSREVLDFPKSQQAFVQTIHELLDHQILPIINENDAVTVDEEGHAAKFEDNDELSLLVAEAVQADLLVMLSDVNGLYSANPLFNEQATMFHQLSEIDQRLIEEAEPHSGTLSRGGIRSKLKTATGALTMNISMVLANGKSPRILFDILAGREVGTLFKK